MLYPKNIKEKLGIDQVLEAAISRCETEAGRQHIHKVRCSGDREQITLWLEQTEELVNILSKGELSISFNVDFDLQSKTAQIEGFFYEIETIQQIQYFLRGLHRITTFSQERREDYPRLYSLFENLDIDWTLIAAIDEVLDIDGEVKPSASKGLQKIITEIKRAERSIIKSSNSIFTNAKEQGLLADTELGIKNGRVVLPVLSEFKRRVSGVLIDQSGTGKISYIEPLELVGLNNELAELHIKKRQEIIQILRQLTSKIVLYLRNIERGMQKASVFDFVRAKARLALDWKCKLPKLDNETTVIRARHPLLEERLHNEKNEIVPLDYTFNEDQRLIVISGPNAGGKSVALKTIGILQFMLQSGYLVPCNAESSFRIFEHIFVDIGDNQSIESDLSTYSSHLKAAKHIINFCDESTLVLMDEIGTGTDPMFGGPMAEAILEEIHRKQAYGVITTHFSNIKTKADKLKGVSNAAMLFDIDKLIPLYKLQIGQPGSSFVYEVASNIGLNKKLIKRAKQLTNTKQYDLDALLSEVQSQQEKLAIEQREINKKAEEAAEITSAYRALKEELDNKKKEIIAQAKEEAQYLIQNANKDIEKTIRVIKETSANKEKTLKARKKLENKIEPSVPKADKTSFVTTLKPGDQVQMLNTSTVGEILEIKRGKATIQVGGMTTKTDVKNLEIVGNKTAKKIKKYISNSSYADKQSSFKTEKDIRGMRTYDALQEIDTWIDNAIILGVSTLRVLHGKGSGILKAEIRRHLKPHQAVKSIRYERVDLGGEGISIVELK
ncbi:Smr/MutS family protein [Bacteroidia bacterium]|nr:Smr/MutS family protein [Bacteroidia bacterium]